MKRKIKIFVSVVFIIAVVLAVFVLLRLSKGGASIAYIPYNGGEYVPADTAIYNQYSLAKNPEDMLGYYLISIEMRDTGTGFFVKPGVKYKYDYEHLNDGLNRLYTVKGMNTFDVLIEEDTYHSFHYLMLENPVPE